MDESPQNRSLTHLARYGRRNPVIWREIDYARSLRGTELSDWPGWCFCPQAVTTACLTDADPSTLADAEVLETSIIGALASWRPTESVYVFDPTILDAVWTTPIVGDIPVEVLYRLPEWGVWIDTRGRSLANGAPLNGFFAHLTYQVARKIGLLSLAFDVGTGEENLIPYSIPLNCGGLHESIAVALSAVNLDRAARGERVDVNQIERDSEGRANPGMVEELACLISPVVSLVLYLCSATAEIRDPAAPTRRPQRASAKKVKSGWRTFPPDRPTIWRVGDRLGEAIRLAENAETTSESRPGTHGAHASPRPHIRRAHWHTYWTGAKRAAEVRSPILKWLPPIPVNLPDTEPSA
jgi:hypothetical protein